MVSPWQHDVTSAGSRLPPWNREEKEIHACVLLLQDLLAGGRLPPWDREEKRRKFVCTCAVSSHLTTVEIDS